MQYVTSKEKRLLCFTLTGLVLSSAVLVRAQFVGPYTLTPPAPGPYFVLYGNMSFGSWTAIGIPLTTFYVETGGAPNTLTLDTGFTSVNNEGVFCAQAAAAGTVTFEYIVYGAGTGYFGWFNSGSSKPTDYLLPQNQLLGSIAGLVSNITSVSFSVAAGDYFGFTLSVPNEMVRIANQRAVNIQNVVMPTNHAPVSLSYRISSRNLVLSWSQGILQSSDDVNGTYTDATYAKSPYYLPLAGSQQFFRVRTP